MYLSQTEVLRLHVHTLREGLQHFTRAGILLADAHQKLVTRVESVGEVGQGLWDRPEIGAYFLP